MTPAEFADRLVGSRYQATIREALRMVFVEGKSQTDAAKAVGVHRQAVSRAVASFQKRV
jgi:predicted DNA-binding protein (UPF0251 family)